MESNLEFDQQEERKAFIQRVRGILPVPLSTLREVAKHYGDGTFLSSYSRFGVHIFGEDDKPIDYAPNAHIILSVREWVQRAETRYVELLRNAGVTDEQINKIRFDIMAWLHTVQHGASRNIRCPNCGQTIWNVSNNLDWQTDMLLVACDNTTGYKFSIDGAPVQAENPHGPLVFEYHMSEWL
jgi:hypothetical protein